MIPGFKLRVEQEMHFLIDNYQEFNELEGIKPYICMAESTFPPNCMNWVGASIIAGLNTEIEMFMTTYEEFKENGHKMPDRFGEAYLFATREEQYLNPDFEYKNQFAKQNLYSSMTPISARSYQEKKLTINQQLERTLTQMKTPTAGALAGVGGVARLGGITPTAGSSAQKYQGPITPSNTGPQPIVFEDPLYNRSKTLYTSSNAAN